MRGALMFLDVFLLEAERFGSVEHEHFHPHIFGHAAAGGLGDDDHEEDRQRHSPDCGLLAEDAEQWMGGPEIIERSEAGENFAHRALVE